MQSNAISKIFFHKIWQANPKIHKERLEPRIGKRVLDKKDKDEIL